MLCNSTTVVSWQHETIPPLVTELWAGLTWPTENDAFKVSAAAAASPQAASTARSLSFVQREVAGSRQFRSALTWRELLGQLELVNFHARACCTGVAFQLPVGKLARANIYES